MYRLLPAVLTGLLIASACAEHKAEFSKGQFVTAKLQCGAVGAYLVEAAPDTIAFYGPAEDQMRQANCLKDKLAGINVHIVVRGSELSR